MDTLTVRAPLPRVGSERSSSAPGAHRDPRIAAGDDPVVFAPRYQRRREPSRLADQAHRVAHPATELRPVRAAAAPR